MRKMAFSRAALFMAGEGGAGVLLRGWRNGLAIWRSRTTPQSVSAHSSARWVLRTARLVHECTSSGRWRIQMAAKSAAKPSAERTMFSMQLEDMVGFSQL